MKYYVVLLLLMIILFCGQVIEIDLPLALNIALLVLILLTTFFWEYSILDKYYESDFKMRSQRKVFGIFEIINPIVWTYILSLNYGKYKEVIFLIMMFWTFPLAELVIWFIYKKKKPFTFFIKDNELILNKRWTQKRNLTELTQIRFNKFSKNLKLDFKSESEISIKTTEYKSDEIQTLLEILIEKSGNEVFVPKNYESKIKTAANKM